MLNTSSVSGQLGISKLEWLIVLVIVLIGGWVVASMLGKEDAKSRIVEEQAAPLIAALERYKSEQGGYPRELSSLTPRYVSELPKCSVSDNGPMPYFVDDATKTFQIICPVGMFSKRRFISASGKWSTFD